MNRRYHNHNYPRKKENAFINVLRLICNFFKRPFYQNCVIFGIILVVLGFICFQIKSYDWGFMFAIVGGILLAVGLMIAIAPYRNSNSNGSKYNVIINQGRFASWSRSGEE